MFEQWSYFGGRQVVDECNDRRNGLWEKCKQATESTVHFFENKYKVVTDSLACSTYDD